MDIGKRQRSSGRGLKLWSWRLLQGALNVGSWRQWRSHVVAATVVVDVHFRRSIIHYILACLAHCWPIAIGITIADLIRSAPNSVTLLFVLMGSTREDE